MPSEDIRKRRLELQNEEVAERSKILGPHNTKYYKLKKDLEDECELIGHFFQEIYHKWGSFDEKRFTHETFGCKYCRKLIHVPYSEVDNIKNRNK
jgi:hypothetical protein